MKLLKPLLMSLVLIPVLSSILPAAPADGLVDRIVHQMPEWSTRPFMYMTVWQWIGLGAAILLGLVVRKIISILLQGVHKIASRRTKTEWDDRIIQAFIGPTGTIAAVGLWFLFVLALRLPRGAVSFINVILQIIASIAFIVLIYRLSNVFIYFLRSVTSKTDTDLDDQLMPIVEKAIKILVVTIGALVALQNLGVNVLSALAGLGLGGLAFALAARDTAANIFGSLTIFMDRPFKMGDWIKINGTHEGIVEAIGIRTTRIRTFAKSLISLPNAIVANSSIENFSERPYRRVYTKLGIAYDTPAEKIEQFVEEIKKIVSSHDLSVDESMYVSFVEYAASSLLIMIYFFLDAKNWDEELKCKQEIYIAIKRKAAEMSIEFAFPTQTIHVETMPQQ